MRSGRRRGFRLWWEGWGCSLRAPSPIAYAPGSVARVRFCGSVPATKVAGYWQSPLRGSRKRPTSAKGGQMWGTEVYFILEKQNRGPSAARSLARSPCSRPVALRSG